ncbi:MAG: tRNA pseudouridine(55) synthase TruB [bacterium]
MNLSFGYLNIDKPRGLTSRDVVDRVEQKLDINGVGHGGTLDPLATGVLPVFLGQATKLIPYLHQRTKVYQVTGRLDCSSETLDSTGEVAKISPSSSPAREDVNSVLEQFVGTINQVPPKYSAVKQGGEPVYEKARRGEDVDLDSRDVDCQEIRCLQYDFPEIELEITCGKGFYVRSLIRDLARELGIGGGIVTELTRLKYGSLDIDRGVKPGQISRGGPGFAPPATVVDHMPRITLSGRRLEWVCNGTWIKRDTAEYGDDSEILALDSNSRIVAILRPAREDDKAMWHPHRVFNRENVS